MNNLNPEVSLKDVFQRWFPDKPFEVHQTIMWNLTAFPAGNIEIIERQVKWAAIRTMPELPGFEKRLEDAMGEVLDRMDAVHEAAKAKDDALQKLKRDYIAGGDVPEQR